MAKSNGGPAFPVPMIPVDREGGFTEVRESGLSLRDWFAATADISFADQLCDRLKEALAGRPEPDWEKLPVKNWRWEADWRSRLRYMLADAMLAEREKCEPS